MNNKILLSFGITLVLGAAATWWYFFPPPEDIGKSPGAKAELPSVDSQGLRSQVPKIMHGKEAARLLSDPRVRAYLDRERDKQALDAYFNQGKSPPSAEDVWQLIESIESDGRVMAYEALALKLAWLERNSASVQAFEQAASDLVARYQRRSQQNTAAYDPYEAVPGFAEYKQVEAQIVEEVQGMAHFPEGMSKQEYLRQRLQEAREKAYSGQNNP
ncbi:hypothetical protein [Microbulbifer sp. 2205BS26-8]|uniref:hypothetical protein n=1 Tax=Microbulbifer sp. 2205BS26-8 TaxID=3064386 RepID=UPI00273F9755|nr:hypothetical protein [Microbulbifer sp. 2205BS26-8]MDP5208431.1 hypothetical protein [Microbulbifer sp. 2205BS26-8]